VYFYSLANEMGVDTIHEQLAPFGLGRRTGIDMEGEVTGDLPSTEWKRRRFKKPEQQKWYAGETISLGIGQGYNNFTMLQMANAMSTLASGGLRFKPRLVHEVQDTVTNERRPVSSQALEPLPLKPEHVTVIRDAMHGVTTGGTSARIFAGAGYLSGGKTGTAQAVGVRGGEKYSASRVAEHLRDHSLYIAFAPVDQPRVALAVIVENAGWGSGAAAPIARRVLDYLLMDQYPSEEDIALVREGKGGAPIGKPRAPAEVPLPAGPGNAVAMGLVRAPDPAASAASAAASATSAPAASGAAR
jgi:penicillin-binding protein 2